MGLNLERIDIEYEKKTLTKRILKNSRLLPDSRRFSITSTLRYSLRAISFIRHYFDSEASEVSRIFIVENVLFITSSLSRL